MLLIPEKHAIVLRLRNPDTVAMVIPRHQRLDEHTIAVRHGIEESKVLRNLGINVPSPILSYYPWPGKYTPFVHQRETSAFLTLNNRCFVFDEMGLGKSLASLWAMDYLMRIKAIRRVLILSTLSCLEPTWLTEIFCNMMHRSSIIVHGSRDVRYNAIAEDVDIYLMNHDGLRVPGVVDKFLKRGDIDLIVVDEAAMLRNSRTKTYTMFKKLLQPHHRLWMLTGQPCPNGPEDAFGLGQLVSPERLPKYFTRWQAETMTKLSTFKWAPKPGSMQRVFEVLQPAIRHSKEECLDLPPTIYLDRHADLSVAQLAAYKAMKEKLRLIQGTDPITAVNAAAKFSKLLQICCGAVHTDVDTYAPLDTGPRLNALHEAIDEANAKVIVFVPYTGALRQVADFLLKAGYTVGVVNGSVTGKARSAILKAFQTTPHPHVLVANPETAAHGLNLTAADTMVWFSPIHSLDTYRQACERMARPGQKNHMRIVHLGCTPLEWGVYKVLRNREAQQQTLFDLYQAEMKSVDML